jgi:hypothetical protein
MQNTLYCRQNDEKTCFRQVITTSWDSIRACDCGIPCEGTKYITPEDLHHLPINERAKIARKIWSSEKPTYSPTLQVVPV